ncbi:hypothetical protein FXN63_10615 [Pigmentiphaga aceris]|uniref:Cytochrome P450 n=1 Tax=Pigmentiphaga aceris TaxID=1940612 RepID=A0A5C0AUZ0_9BURK|nr:hypothetical protein [Pigmentiphaga aceris]QEI06239.1 hypothetical protein FXN63_10615 [Pigmentiphaga aceris]
MHPNHPLDAASHRNPYPYYRHLLTRAPLVYNDDLRLWIAARSSTVYEIFEHPACRVRPASEPVPLRLDRPQRRIFGFGRGAHACPGQLLATNIVSTALAVLLDKLDEQDLAHLNWHYLPYSNGRLPQFTAAKPRWPL